MGWVWTVAINGMLGLAGYWGARHGLRQAKGAPRTIGASVLAWAWATIGLQILGPLGLLSLGPVAAWTAAGLVLAGFWRFRHPGPPDLPGKPGERWGFAAVVALSLSIWAMSTFFLPSLLLAVKVVSDGPIYHLYFAARWWKEGRLFLIASPFGESAATYFPAGGDLWFTWLMIPLGGDRLARVGQAPFLLLSATAAYASARRLGASAGSSLVATTWFLGSLPLILFSFEPNVDTIFIAGYLSAAYFFLRFALGDDEMPALALGGLAVGLTWGTKPTATVFVPFLLAAVGLVILCRRVSWRRRIAQLCFLASATLLPTAYWFARNALLSGGNPLYPAHLSAFGRVWLSGWYDSEAMKRSPFYLPREDWRSFVDILVAVLDPRQVPLWLLSLAGAWRLGSKRPGNAWVWGFSALAALNVALYWLAIPYRTQQRFMLQALGLWVVPLALLLDRGRAIRGLAVVLLAVHLMTPHSWPFELPGGGSPWDLSDRIPNVPLAPIRPPRTLDQWRAALSLPAERYVFLSTMAFGLASFGVAWSWSWAARRPSVRRWALALGVSTGTLGLQGYGTLQGTPAVRQVFPAFPDYFRAWIALNQRSGPSGARVAYAGTNIPYYLLGEGLKNDVRYVNIDSHPGWLLHDYHRRARSRGQGTWHDPRPTWDRAEPDYGAWLDNLRAERVQLLVVARAKPEDGPMNLADRQWFTIERGWAESHPESFTPVYGVVEGDPEMRIYRVHIPPK